MTGLLESWLKSIWRVNFPMRPCLIQMGKFKKIKSILTQIDSFKNNIARPNIDCKLIEIQIPDIFLMYCFRSPVTNPSNISTGYFVLEWRKIFLWRDGDLPRRPTPIIDCANIPQGYWKVNKVPFTLSICIHPRKNMFCNHYITWWKLNVTFRSSKLIGPEPSTSLSRKESYNFVKSSYEIPSAPKT